MSLLNAAKKQGKKPMAKKPVRRRPSRVKSKRPKSYIRPDHENSLDSGQSELPDPTQTKISPCNLTARAEFRVVGNPVVTRPEDAIANCYPGLELDIRNLDRRFFPGLVFNFVEPADERKPGMEYGAKLAYVDARQDPDVESGSDLFGRLTGDEGKALAVGNWYLEWIKQDEKLIRTRDSHGTPLTGLTVWRLIRGLEPRPRLVRIGLHRRDRSVAPVELHGWRRTYADPTTGVISGAYQPGELMQGLCSPWQHDFRDCYCHYWASNRPDFVFGDVYPGESLLPGGDAADASLNLRLDWMRADRSRELAVGAFDVIEKNRPYQFDHYQINHEWQKLNIVLNGREIDSVHFTAPADTASPYDEKELVRQLRVVLAPLEVTLAFEYLYARFSLRDPADPNEVNSNDRPLQGALALAREYLLLIAISEMQHLRWDNEILWDLHKAKKIKRYIPIIKPAELVPEGTGGWLRATQATPVAGGRLRRDENTIDEIVNYVRSKRKAEFFRASDLEAPTSEAFFEYVKDNLKAKYPDQHDLQGPIDEAADQLKEPGGSWGWRERALRLLDRDVQDDFIKIEHPNAFIDHHYARVLATLELGEYPPHLAGLVRRILSDGVQHESRFNAIKAAFEPFEPDAYLRTGLEATKSNDTKPALDLRDDIIAALNQAYTARDQEDVKTSSERIAVARDKMNKLLQCGERLAKANKGIPFFDGL
jgi:hypothetical protein